MSRTKWRSARSVPRLAVGALSATALVVAMAVPVGANDPLPPVCAEATGIVTDPWGNGVSGVNVDWVSGNRRCTGIVGTDTAGQYSTQLEVATSPSLVRATSPFTSSRTQAMQPDVQTTDRTTHDFQLWYVIAAPAVTPVYVKPGATVTVTVRTSAPRAEATPGAKVIAQVGSAPAVVLDQGVTGADRFTTWTLTYPVAAGAADGRRDVSLCAVRAGYTGTSCAAAIAAGQIVSSPTSPTTASFVVDGTAPDTLAGRIFPLSGTQTQFTSQPLAAVVSDPTAGFTASAAVFSLTNTTTGTTTTHQGLTVAGAWVRTAPVTLTTGHHYRAALTVTDRAGNATTVTQNDVATGGGFRVVSVTAPAATARADDVTCTLGPRDVHSFPPMRTATCTGVTVVADPVDVALSASMHGGDSWITQNVSLANLRVHATTTGVEVATVAPFTSTVAVRQPFRLADRATGSVTAATAAGTAPLAPVVVKVPAAADGAYVSMPPTTALSAATAACADPSAAVTFCSPDPIPPVTSQMPVDDVVAIKGGLMAVSLNDGANVGIGTLGSAVDLETVTRTDGTTVEGLTVMPPEAITEETRLAVEAIREAADSSVIGYCAELMRFDRPTLRMSNGPLRPLEQGTPDDIRAQCSGGGYVVPDDLDHEVENSCWISVDGGTWSEARQGDGIEDYERVRLFGCYTRDYLADVPEHDAHTYADISRVSATTCDYAQRDCGKIRVGASLVEAKYHLKIVTATHSYRRTEDFYSGGLVYDPNPTGPQAFPDSCEQTATTTGFTISISYKGFGGTIPYTRTRERTQCKEHAIPHEDAFGVFGVDWRGTAPNGNLGKRVTVAGNGVRIKNRHPSNFKFHMDALTDPVA